MADNIESSFLEGNGIVILLLFFLMFGWGNGFGNNGNQANFTRAEMSDGFNTNEIKNGIGSLTNGQYDLNNSILGNRYENAVGLAGIDKSVMQSRYDTLLGQNALAAQIAQNRYDAALQAQNMQAQMASCCCDIKTAITTDGAMTRAMIQQQTIDDLKSQLNTATNAIANAEQTRNLLGQMGRWIANSPAGYGSCGCGA